MTSHAPPRLDVPAGGAFLFDPAGSTPLFTPEDLTAEQRALGETARRFADSEILPRLDEIEAQEPGLMRELLGKAGELGLLMLDVPEEYGGLDQAKTTTMLITERLNRCASFAVSFGAHIGIGTLPLVYFGTDEQKQKYLPKLGSGEWIAAYALTEPESGSDALSVRTRAKLSGDGSHYVLDGAKQWITNAGFADLFVVFAKIEGKGFSALLVERESTGLSVGAEEKKHGLKGSSTCSVTFDGVQVPAENLLGEAGKGHRIAFSILNLGRARLGMGCVGGSKYALSIATEYARGRVQFEKPLTDFGLIRAKLGEMACRIFAGESVAYRTAGLIDAKVQALRDRGPLLEQRDLQRSVEEYAIETSILKVLGSEILDFVVDEALQIHGGYGYMVEYGIERARRDARINRIFEGTNEINRLLLAGTLLKRSMQQELPLMAVAGGLEAALDEGSVPVFEPLTSSFKELEQQVQRMKSALLYAGLQAVKRYMMELENEQAILGAIADSLIDVFAADSALARLLQVQEQRGEEDVPFYHDCATLFVEQARDRVFERARSILCRALERDRRDEALENLARLDRPRPLDRLGLRDRIAETVVRAGGWPLS